MYGQQFDSNLVDLTYLLGGKVVSLPLKFIYGQWFYSSFVDLTHLLGGKVALGGDYH